MTITLLGKPRSTGGIYKNAVIKGFVHRYMSDEGRTLKESYQWKAKSQWKGKPVEGDVTVDIIIYFGDKRKNDWDNFHKLSMDALTGIVWIDDSQIIKATVIKEYDKLNPRIEITIIK